MPRTIFSALAYGYCYRSREMEAIRNLVNDSVCMKCKQYLSYYGVEVEQVESFTPFPCRYHELNYVAHSMLRKKRKVEDVYAYQPFLCPIVGIGECKFSGKRNQLLAHCQKAHPDNVIENSFQLIQNINKSSTHNYILATCQELFLVQSRVCVTSQKLIYSVRLIADPRNAVKYQFNVDVQNHGIKHSGSGNVAPQGCLAVPEDKSVVFNIGQLRKLLRHINNVTYRVSVKKICDEIPADTTYHPYMCPIAKIGMCKWTGVRSDLLGHCWLEHADNVIDNHCTITHNISKPSEHNYILSAYRELFFVQTNVCIESKKIYYSVRLIGNAKRAMKYQCHIYNKEFISGNVAPQGCLGVREDKLLVADIQSETGNYINIIVSVTKKVRLNILCNLKIKRCKVVRNIFTH